MQIIADLHIHSRYSRATSKDMNLIELDRWADDKGITVISTGDFTHPEHFKDITTFLEPAEEGLFVLKKQDKKKTLKNTYAQTRFILTVEISSIYSRKGKTHRIHNLIFAPNIATVKKINHYLSLIGNLKSDGRPILGIDSEELAKIVLNINADCAIIPAHAWTPWFSLFGSMSGFDSIEECFGSFAKAIFAIETGLSSDPLMNWRLSALDSISLISNSDSHSLKRIGREANIFDTELSYRGIINAIKDGAPTNRRQEKQNPHHSRFVATIEFFPEEGKYHFDGHRACGIAMSPKDTKKNNGICPVCKKRLTIGVLHRVDMLADRNEDEAKKLSHERVPYTSLIPLDEIIAAAHKVGVNTKRVAEEYKRLINAFQNEINILTSVPPETVAQYAHPRVAEGIRRVREKKVFISPGHDGEYGTISLFQDQDQTDMQKSLF